MANAVISAAGAGDNTLVAAPASPHQFIRVLGYVLIASNTVSVTWKSGASTALSGAMPLIASSGAVANETPEGWFDCTPGDALVLNLSGAVGVFGHLVYAIKGS